MASTEGKTIICNAAVVHDLKKKAFNVEKVKVLPPTPGHVRIKMVATSLCHSDLSTFEGTFPLQKLPYIPGHEGAGIVESVGEGVTHVQRGDKVLTLFLPHCGECPTCVSRHSNVCLDAKRKVPILAPFLRTEGLDGLSSFSTLDDKTIYHSFGTSSFSEYTVIPANSCVKVHPGTKLQKACIMACGFMTGYGTSTKAVNIQLGDSVAVFGLGGVGLACLAGCKDKGAGKIIGIDLDDKKEALAKKFGCTDFIALSKFSSNEEVVKKIMELTTIGVDFAFACAGSAQSMENAIACLGLGGTVVIAGFTKAMECVKFDSNDLVSHTKRIKGSIYGDCNIFEDVPKVVERYVQGKLPIEDFITGVFTLDKINSAIEQMEQGKSIRSVIEF